MIGRVVDRILGFLRRNVILVALALVALGLTGIAVEELLAPGASGLKASLLKSAGKVGLAIFTGGVFSVFFKALQASGVFREELAAVVYGRHHLSQRKDIEVLWRNVTRALHNDRFPELESKITDRVIATYLPTNRSYYYRRMHRDYDITWYDRERNLVKIVTTVSSEIVPSPSQRTVAFQIAYAGRTIEGIRSRQFSLTKFRVGRQSAMKKLKAQERKSDSDPGETLWRYDGTLRLPTTAEMELQVETIQSLEVDRVVTFSSVSYVDGLVIDVTFPSETMKLHFAPLGTEDAFTVIELPNPARVKREYKGLLFSQQGFTMVLLETKGA